MTDNNDPDNTVMASVHYGDGTMSFVAEAPLTVISLTGYNNTATAAFAIATTSGPAATHVAATLAASKIANGTQIHVPAALTASEATLVAMASKATLAEAPLPVIYPTGHNNTATAAFAIATTGFCALDALWQVSTPTVAKWLMLCHLTGLCLVVTIIASQALHFEMQGQQKLSRTFCHLSWMMVNLLSM